MDKAMSVILIMLALLSWFSFLKRLFWHKAAPVKKVKAEVVDNYKPNIISKYPGVNRQEYFIIVFKTQKKESFLYGFGVFCPVLQTEEKRNTNLQRR